MKKVTISTEVAEGVYIKRKDDDSTWNYYFRLHNKAFRKSTKTRDRNKAAKIALDDYHHTLERANNKQQIERVSFRKLSNKYLEYIKSQHKHTYHSETTKRHILPFFKKFDDVSRIHNKDILEYVVARQKKADGKVTNQTINRENSVLRQMLNFGIEYGCVSKEVRVKPLSDAKSVRRAHFAIKEYEHLLKVSRKRVNEYDPTKKTSNKKMSAKELGRLTQQYWSRNLLHDVIIIIANTGLRVGELATVRWKDIDFDASFIQLHHAGKVKSSRRVYMRGYAPIALERILKRRYAYLKEKKAELSNTEKVQSFPNGIFVKSMKKGFRELIRACEFKYDKKSDRHALTSLRHTFATLRLTDTSDTRTSLRTLAKQMGTSEKMIEDHYGHDTIDDYKDQIIGTKQTHKKVKVKPI